MHACRARPAEAAGALVASVSACPCNRDAWQALAKLVASNPDIAGEGLPQHWTREAHLISVALDAQENAEALSRVQVRGWSNASAVLHNLSSLLGLSMSCCFRADS